MVNSLLAIKKSQWVFMLLIFSVFISIGIVGLLKYNYNAFPVVDISNMNKDSSSISFYIDTIEFRDDYLYVWGWAVGNEENAMQTIDCSVALQNMVDGTVHKMKSAMQIRSNLPDALGINGAEKGGFQAYVKLNRLFDNVNYRVLLLYCNNQNNILVDTNIEIDNKHGVIYE